MTKLYRHLQVCNSRFVSAINANNAAYVKCNVVCTEMAVFRDVAPCFLKFRRRVLSSSHLITRAICFCETSVIIDQTLTCTFPADTHLNTRRRENPISHLSSDIFVEMLRKNLVSQDLTVHLSLSSCFVGVSDKEHNLSTTNIFGTPCSNKSGQTPSCSASSKSLGQFPNWSPATSLSPRPSCS